MSVCLLCEAGADPGALSVLAQRWRLTSDDDAPMALVLTPQRLELRKRDEPKLGGIYVDFVTGAMAHRRRFGGGRGEAVAKAVGIKGSYLPDVVDATAGLGRDAFVLAALGCRVRMLERNPVVAALLDDGLQRGYQDAEIGPWLRDRLTLLHASSLTALADLSPRPEVVYLDPMFPHKQKSALVKKEMRVFQSLVGSDDDADGLLEPARRLATKRVVVKRPDYAPPLADVPAHAATLTKATVSTSTCRCNVCRARGVGPSVFLPQTFPHAAGRMHRQQGGLVIAAARHQAGAGGVEDRQHQHNRGGGQHVQRIYLPLHPGGDCQLRRLCDGGMRVFRHRDQRHPLGLQRRQQAGQLVGIAAARDQDQQIVGAQEAQIAVRRAGGVEIDRRPLHAGQHMGYLARRNPRGADAGDGDFTAAVGQQRQQPLPGARIEAFAQLRQLLTVGLPALHGLPPLLLHHTSSCINRRYFMWSLYSSWNTRYLRS